MKWAGMWVFGLLAVAGTAIGTNWARAGEQSAQPVATETPRADGGQPAKEEEGSLPEALPGMTDTSFDRYVDLHVLAAGWQGLDAELLTDTALQLAEGERILQRKHHSGITAEQVLRLATRVAIETRNKDALERLDRAARSQNAKELQTMIAAAKSTIATPRSGEPAAKISVDKTTPENLARLRETVSALSAAKVAGDVEGVAAIGQEIADSGDFGDEERAYLGRLAAEAKTAVGETPDPLADPLRKLSAGSRGNESNRDAVRAGVEGGGWNIVWGVTVNEPEYVKLTAAIAASVASGNPGPVMQYFSDYLNQSIAKFQKNAPGVALTALRNTVFKALKDRGQTFRIGRVGVKGGIATYRRWYTVTTQVPDGTERYKIKGPWGSWTWGYRPKYKTVTKNVPLPNWHQPYVGFRLY